MIQYNLLTGFYVQHYTLSQTPLYMKRWPILLLVYLLHLFLEIQKCLSLIHICKAKSSQNDEATSRHLHSFYLLIHQKAILPYVFNVKPINQESTCRLEMNRIECIYHDSGARLTNMVTPHMATLLIGDIPATFAGPCLTNTSP